MPTEIVTTDDLREFKVELIDEIKRILAVHHGQVPQKWLKSNEVRKLLGISPGTLQTLRSNGTIPYVQLGGKIFYDSKEINRVMRENAVNLVGLRRRRP